MQWWKDSLFNKEMMLGKLVIYMEKNAFGPLSYAVHKNQLKMG